MTPEEEQEQVRFEGFGLGPFSVGPAFFAFLKEMENNLLLSLSKILEMLFIPYFYTIFLHHLRWHLMSIVTSFEKFAKPKEIKEKDSSYTIIIIGLTSFFKNY